MVTSVTVSEADKVAIFSLRRSRRRCRLCRDRVRRQAQRGVSGIFSAMRLPSHPSRPRTAGLFSGRPYRARRASSASVTYLR